MKFRSDNQARSAKTYIFRSKSNNSIYAFTRDKTASNLPTELSPWTIEAVHLDSDPAVDNHINTNVRMHGYSLCTDDPEVFERERAKILAGCSDKKVSLRAAKLAETLLQELTNSEKDIAAQVLAVKMLTIHLVRSVETAPKGIDIYVKHLLEFAEHISRHRDTHH